jgi:hypothetical protein
MVTLWCQIMKIRAIENLTLGHGYIKNIVDVPCSQREESEKSLTFIQRFVTIYIERFFARIDSTCP